MTGCFRYRPGVEKEQRGEFDISRQRIERYILAKHIHYD